MHHPRLVFETVYQLVRITIINDQQSIIVIFIYKIGIRVWVSGNAQEINFYFSR
jgi:hypothetical protein